ncbi:asparagine synthase-related protein [Sphingomonas cannabina]|uniref:asparagine synthetase B family protein n=1 Tax=Sphingomonas cannabina TaxID=2899123 RepID=UPI001F472BAE|nr:asparagine synthetase B family protein [Sphingomonas cannabina]UIJ46188.1 asparagine synthase-related protein [Sphingomonas cannabina]
MSICGRAATDPDAPLPIDRTLRAVTIGSARTARQWSAGGVRLAAADDAALATAPGEYAALFDGQLHNAAEVIAALGPGAPARSGPAELALAAYRRWGEDFADRLIGDYACAVWDGESRRLALATDPGEMRPLFYWIGPHGELRFASEMGALWSEGDVPRSLDEDRICEWLTLLPMEAGRTLFSGIARVTGGSAAVWEAGRSRTTRWWRPERLPTLRLRDDDYPRAVLACLEEAVACRIAGDERIGSHLSGGLDSSGVTALAARRLAGEGRSLTAFTAAPDHSFIERPGRFGDEWGHAARVAAMHANIEHVRISNTDTPLEEVLDRRTQVQDVPLLNLSNTVWGSAIDREARDRRIGVMLIGQMGNMSFSYDGGELLGMEMRRGRIDRVAATLLAIRRAQHWRWATLAGAFADAAFPDLARRLRKLVGKGPPEFFDCCAINRDFLRARGREGEVLAYGGDLRRLSGGDSRMLRLGVLARSSIRGDFARTSRRLYGVDTRDPTIDRRLFELCLTIPEEQFLHHGVHRSLARRALRGIIPDLLVDEYRKGLQAADWAHGFEAALSGLKAEVARLRESRGSTKWIDLDRVQRMLDAWPGADAAGRLMATEYTTAVSRAIATGRFIRKIEGGNA